MSLLKNIGLKALFKMTTAIPHPVTMSNNDDNDDNDDAFFIECFHAYWNGQKYKLYWPIR